MAKSGIAVSNELRKEIYEKELFEDMLKESFWMKFWGGSKSAVHVKKDLTKTKGDEIHFGLRARLTGAGVEDGQVLEGAEEKMNDYHYSTRLKRYRHA